MADIDDSSLQGRLKHQCAHNVSDTVHLLDNLGFTVHDKKSVLIPTKEIIVVSFALKCKITSGKERGYLKLCLSISKRSHNT